MSKTKVELTTQQKFVLVVKHQLKAICTMIDNANDAGLTTKTSNDIEIIIKLIEAMESNKKESELVEMFIAKSEYWHIIDNRDLQTLERDFPKMFEKLPVNKETLSEPIRVYMKEKKKTASKKAPVIGDKHIEAMWTNLEKLVHAGAKYDSENGSKFRTQCNLDKYYVKYSL